MGLSWSSCPSLFLYYIIIIVQSILSPTLWTWTSEHPASPAVGQHHQTASVFITNSLAPFSLRPVTWEAEVGHVQWDIRQEKEETGWLIGDVSPGGVLLAFWQKKNDWQWVFAWLADIGTQRWVSGVGQDGKRRARMRTRNKVMQTVSPTKLWRGKRPFEVKFLTALFDFEFEKCSKQTNKKNDNNWNNFSFWMKEGNTKVTKATQSCQIWTQWSAGEFCVHGSSTFIYHQNKAYKCEFQQYYVSMSTSKQTYWPCGLQYRMGENWDHVRHWQVIGVKSYMLSFSLSSINILTMLQQSGELLYTLYSLHWNWKTELPGCV